MKNKKLDEQQIIAAFKEAVKTLKKLPSLKVQGYYNAWPEIVYSKAEIRQMDQKPKTWRPTPEAISRMEQTISWLNLLETTQERKLVWMRASNIPWNEICKIFGFSRVTGSKKYKNALCKIMQKYL